MITSAQASRMLDDFKYYELCYEISNEQQQKKGYWSTLNAVLHKKAAWKHAAQAILRYPLPVLQTKYLSVDASEHIEAIEQFAKELRTWLENFESNLCEYMQNEKYKNSVISSNKALEKRCGK